MKKAVMACLNSWCNWPSYLSYPGSLVPCNPSVITGERVKREINADGTKER